MNKKIRIRFVVSACLLILFVLYTAAVMHIDVKPIGPDGSAVGFSAINGWVHGLFGVHMLLYQITDWAGIAVILVALGFAVLGLIQLIKRKSLLRVDGSILVLGGFYVLVFCAYLFFEFYIVNYRPVLIDGILEPSYPSSTTMLALCVMPAAVMQFCRLIKNRRIRLPLNALCILFTAFMVIARLLSGVHWFTDILGGALLSAALLLLYAAVSGSVEAKQAARRPELGERA